MVDYQIGSYGWNGIFMNVLVTGQKVEKSYLVKNNVSITADDWFVGDTGKDIETGKQLVLHTAAVTCGFQSFEKLLEYNPEVTANSVIDLEF